MDIGYKSTAGADVIIKILLWCLIFAKWLAVIYEVMILQWTSLRCNKGEQARKRGLWKSPRTSLPLSWLALTVNLTQPRASWQRASAEDAELPGSDWPARGRGGGECIVLMYWCRRPQSTVGDTIPWTRNSGMYKETNWTRSCVSQWASSVSLWFLLSSLAGSPLVEGNAV